MIQQIYQRFKRFVENNRLFSAQSRLLVAVSGGQDSVALVHLLLELRKEWPEMEVALAHFNHKLRKSADADERFVRRLAKDLGLKVFVGRTRVREYARRHGLNLEEAGRLKRYEFLEKVAEKWGAEVVLTAHTMTDQAETVLMRIFRGTGVEGLQGIRLRAGKVVRPMLCLRREEIEQYLKEKNLKYRVDESNLDTSLLRNKIRLKLLPLLEKEYDGGVVIHLAQLALIAQDENEAMSELVDGLWPMVVRNRGHNNNFLILEEEGECPKKEPRLTLSPSFKQRGEIDTLFPALELNISALKEMPMAVSRRLVRKFLHVVLGMESPSFEQTQAVLALEDGQKFSWGQDKVLIRENGWLKRVEVAKKKVDFSFLWDGRQSIQIHKRWEFQGMFVSAKKLGKLEYDDSKRCYLDADKLNFPLEVRSRKPGDKYRPLGMSGEKKLKDLLGERKIPQEERDLLPVFVSGGKIVWAPGLPVSDEFKITGKTRKIFLIEKRGTTMCAPPFCDDRGVFS